MPDEPLPTTILYPERFLRDKPAGFDGVFDWAYLESAFDNVTTGIKPMDLDAQVEHNHFFLRFETKNIGAAVPWGQKRAIRADLEIGVSTYLTIWGKQGEPEHFTLETPLNGRDRIFCVPYRIVEGPADKYMIWRIARAWFELVRSLERDAWLDALAAVVEFHRFHAMRRQMKDGRLIRPLRTLVKP